MINKLAKAQKGWIAKLILSLTGISFVSIFGVTEYINRAGANRTVVKVDNIEISQAQFSYLTQKELQEAKKRLGAENEISEELEQALIYEQIQKVVRNAVLDRTAQKYHIAFRPALMRSLIVNQPAFQDNNGNFNREAYQRYLSENNLTESEMLTNLKRNLVRDLIINLPVQNFAVPEPLVKAMAQVDNRRKTFKYLEISPDQIKVDRQISQDEIEQYYEDFGSSFIEPERRDVAVLYLSNADIEKEMDISEEELRTFYDENRQNYDTPEKRQILQIIANSEDQVNEIYNALQNGEDFYNVAKEFAGQSKEDVDLGYVAFDELTDDMADAVFAMNKGAFSEPLSLGDQWQILKVADIKAGKTIPFETLKAEIKAGLVDEKFDEALYDTAAELDDKIAADKTLEDLASEYNTTLFSVKGLADDGTYTYATPQIRDLLKNSDFLETAFSYTLDETSQVIDLDEGLLVVRSDKIVPEHQKPITDVKEDVRKIWIQNEKTAIVQELLNDVMHDLENGDDISQTGKRYHLDVYRTQPITRKETFANVDSAEIRQMFAEPLNVPHQIEQGDKYIIAVADKDYKNSAPLSDLELAQAKMLGYLTMQRDFASAMLKSYADDYKIRIKYKLLGIED